MTAKVKKNRRDGAALIASAVAHVVVIAILISQAPPDYVLPEPPAPPMDVQIMTAPDIPLPPIIPPKMTPRKVVTQVAPPPTPTPPTPEPKPTPAPPAPPKPLPSKPTPPKPTTVVTPAPPTPPTAQPQPPKPAPPKSAPPSPPTPVAAPAKLNIHKPKEDAPANVATLPMAPSPSPTLARPGAPAGGVPAGGAQTPGSRLSGLTPYPLGAMPSGGTGLRGTLVGCANADTVHLSSVERAHCNERFGVEITHAPVLDGIAPAKRAAYDKAAAAQDRSLHAGVMDPMGSMEARHGRPTDFGGGVLSGPASTYVRPGGPP